MVFRPVARPGGGGGSVVAGPVVEREIAPFYREVLSNQMTWQEIRDYLDQHDGAAYSFDQIWVDLISVGGGGAGICSWDYSRGLFGGFPGEVRRHRLRLSDIWSSETTVVTFAIGAGGQYETSGGMTEIAVYDSATEEFDFLFPAQGGQPGTAPDFLSDPDRGLAMHASVHEAAALTGYKGVDLSKYALSAGYFYPPYPIRAGNVDGPGIGGYVFSFPIFDGGTKIGTEPSRNSGGNANCLRPNPPLGGMPEIDVDPEFNSVDGQDADPDVFDSYGGGGGVGEADPTAPSSGIGGRGGRPGGGGGATLFNGDQEAWNSEGFGVGGAGGDGGVTLRFTVLEIAQ